MAEVARRGNVEVHKGCGEVEKEGFWATGRRWGRREDPGGDRQLEEEAA